MMRILALLAVLVLLPGVACSRGKTTVATCDGFALSDIRVNTTFDPSARFPQSATFGWDTGNPQLPDDVRVDPLVLETRLREAITQALAQKNYQLRGYAPDFRVGYRVAITTDEFADVPEGRYTLRDGWIPAMAGARKVEQGALLIDVIDAQSQRLVWQGVCEANVTMTADDETKRDRLDQAVAALLADFPPGSGGSE